MKVERGIVLLLLTLAAFSSTVVVAPTLGQKTTSAPEVLRAQRFELIDSEGKMVARIAAMPQGFPGVGLWLGESPMAVVSVLELAGGAVWIQANDSHGRGKALLSFPSDTSATFLLKKFDGDDRAVFGVNPDGSSYVEVTEVKQPSR